MNTFEKAQRIINKGIKVAKSNKGRCQLESITLYAEYAEPGYSTKSGVIALGNWNGITRFANGKHEDVDDTPERVGKLLERMGVELEWEDEWTSCHQCGKLVRTSADSYCWQASFADVEGELLCHECLKEDPETFLNSLERQPNRCNTITDIDPTDYGYFLLQDGYESGYHPGQDASPKLVAQALEDQGVTRYLFQLDKHGQFDVNFSVYVHKSQRRKLNKKKFSQAKINGPSPSQNLKKLLESTDA